MGSKIYGSKRVVHTNPIKIEEIICQYFDGSFATSNTQWANLDMVLECVPINITKAMDSKLSASFTVNEIWTVIKQMHPTKSLGPNGFLAPFYKNKK